MPANLSPQYLDAEKKFRSARTDEERLIFLREMLATIPKHKGTEKMQADLKTKISRITKQLQGRSSKSGRRVQIFRIQRQGAAQAVILGAPNSGKSQLLATLTNAEPEVAPYPYTTVKPNLGMMEFEDILIQLVDTSPITESHLDWWVNDVTRTSDLALLVADLSKDDGITEVSDAIERLGESKVLLGVHEELEIGQVNPKTLLLALKMDSEGAEERFETLEELYGAEFEIVPVRGEPDEIKRRIFQALDIVRVYTKSPGRPIVKEDPVVLPAGSTVLDAAKVIHKDFAKGLKYARMWGEGYKGQRVERDHVLVDGDVLEFHL
jgi:ribosome-interacting GTPase 1